MEVKFCVFYMPFTSFIFLNRNLVSYFFFFESIYFSDNVPLTNNILIKNITENFIQFSLQKYCLDYTADFIKSITYFYDDLIILFYSKHNRNHE